VTPPHTSTTALAQEVAVIGSGPSGLAAVFRLEQAGYRVRVFESGAKLGRRMRTFERDGFLIEEGATQIAKSYSSILGILHSAGLSSELLPASSQLGMLDPAGKTHNFEVERIHWDMAMTDIISRSKLMLAKLVIEAVKYRKELDKSDLSKLTALDGMSAELYGRQLVGEEVYNNFVDPVVRGFVGTAPANVSASCMLFVFATFMSRQKFFALRGGVGSYAEMLARRFDVTLDAEVQGVEEKGSGVELTWRDQAGVDHVERFQGAVIATLPKQAATIHTKIDPFRREFLATKIGNASIAAIQVALDRVPPETASMIYSTEQSQKDAILAASLEHRKLPGRYPEGKSLITLYANCSWSLDLPEQDDDLITKKLLDAGTALVPTVGDDILFTHVTRWPYSWMQSYPGYWTAMRGFRKAGSGDTRIQLAGDYFCTSTSTPPAPRVSGPLATFSPTSSHLTQHRKERTRLCRRRSSFPASELPSPRSPSSSG
jgi:protoporphyrinogen/coproporphyrinogen III oxidase